MRRRILLGGLSAVALATSIAPAARAAEAETDAGTISELVVTANKREQSVYDVASSVTAVDTTRLQSQGINGLMGMAELVPGLSFFSRARPAPTR